MNTISKEDEELIEKLAAIEHERWADWQRWCHKVLRENNPSPEQGDILERWDRQIETPYSELSEREKQSDRDQVMRYWPLIKLRDQQIALAAQRQVNAIPDVVAGHNGLSDYDQGRYDMKQLVLATLKQAQEESDE